MKELQIHGCNSFVGVKSLVISKRRKVIEIQSNEKSLAFPLSNFQQDITKESSTPKASK